jgi:hypothetical protein
MIRHDYSPADALDTLRDFIEKAQRTQDLVDELMGVTFNGAPKTKAHRKAKVKVKRAAPLASPMDMKAVLGGLTEVGARQVGEVAAALGVDSPSGRANLSTHLTRAKKEGWVKHRAGGKGKPGKWMLTTKGHDYLNA